jgi:hypothetical protein
MRPIMGMKKMKGERTVVTRLGTFRYRFGVTSVVIVIGDKKRVIDYSTLTGRSWDTLERGQHKRTSDGMVTPDDVREYIEQHPDVFTVK